MAYGVRRRLGYENPNYAQLRDRRRSSNMVDEQLSQWVNGRRAPPPCEIAPNADYALITNWLERYSNNAHIRQFWTHRLPAAVQLAPGRGWRVRRAPRRCYRVHQPP